MSQFLHGDENEDGDDDNDDTKAIPILRVFSGNSRAKKCCENVKVFQQLRNWVSGINIDRL